MKDDQVRNVICNRHGTKTNVSGCNFKTSISLGLRLEQFVKFIQYTPSSSLASSGASTDTGATKIKKIQDNQLIKKEHFDKFNPTRVRFVPHRGVRRPIQLMLFRT